MLYTMFLKMHQQAKEQQGNRRETIKSTALLFVLQKKLDISPLMDYF